MPTIHLNLLKDQHVFFELFMLFTEMKNEYIVCVCIVGGYYREYEGREASFSDDYII